MMLVMNHGGRGQYRMGIYKKEIISIHGEHTNRVFFFFLNFVLLKNWLNFFFQKLVKLAKSYTWKIFKKVPIFLLEKGQKNLGNFYIKKNINYYKLFKF